MSIISMLEWVESTDLSTAIREGALPYPILGGFHLLGIALFGGMVLARALDDRQLSDTVRRSARHEVMERTGWDDA